MSSIFRWGCLLIFALIAPIALPAGGGNRSKIEIIQSQRFEEIFFANESCILFSDPSLISKPLREIQPGTPVKVVRVWVNESGQNWMHVKLATPDFIEIPSSVIRGWISV
ncbi:SH3 domain-containing protein [Prochlorococcus marinus]|uniref:SH3 domain-containing protein n=1 Tax=Prochlorococcus marinus TaxID=1219 RepID=UPI0022B4D526|nr:SH3 domain-containing protein [Prochlorococcus marinus]